MMKRTLTLALLFIGAVISMEAQKFALVDMEYILKNIPAYERANEQLNQTSKKWQAEVEALNSQAQALYKNYQNEVVFLSAEQKKAKEEAILSKEKEASDLFSERFSSSDAKDQTGGCFSGRLSPAGRLFL